MINYNYNQLLSQSIGYHREYHAVPHPVGSKMYGLGRILTKPFELWASDTTKLFGPHSRPGKLPKTNRLKQIKRMIRFLPLLAIAIPLGLIGLLFRLVASLWKNHMSLIESAICSPRSCSEALNLSFMTFNAGLMPNAIRNVNNLTHSSKRAREIVAALNPQTMSLPDLICFQEAFDTEAVSILCNGLRNNYHHILHSIAPRELGLNSGLVIASKYPIVEANYRPFKDLSAEDALANKGLVRAVLKLGEGRTAVVYNTHLQAKEEPKYAQIRLQEMRQIRSWMEEDAANDSRNHVGIFLMGDFNISKKNEKGEESSEYEEAVQTLGADFHNPYYTDHDDEGARKYGWTESFPQEPKGSWYAQQKSQVFPQVVQGYCLDHQFIFRGAKKWATHSQIQHFQLSSMPQDRKSGVSDHLPLYVKYQHISQVRSRARSQALMRGGSK